MIIGAASLTISHETVRQAVQEYLARHCVEGSVPEIEAFDLSSGLTWGTPIDKRTFTLRLAGTLTAVPLPQPRGARAMDLSEEDLPIPGERVRVR